MSWICLAAACLSAEMADAPPAVARLPGVVVTLLDEADVPAREAGVLLSITAREGTTVEKGQVLGQIDDTDARLRLAKAQAELQQAQQTAENDIKTRFARKSADVALAELQRAKDASSQFNRSVSETELDRLQLLADKSALEIEQAQIDLAAAGQLRDVKARDVDLEQLRVEHRKITAPLTGMVVQWRQHVGEWVEPGTPVVRVIRLNRLRAEGFASATTLTPGSVGCEIRLRVDDAEGKSRTYVGELAFVSPEIDPVNGQVRFWAEIDNSKLDLRPGTVGVVEVSRESSSSVTNR